MIVVDCSAAVDALVAPDAEDLDDLFSSNRLIAPHLIDFEMVNAIRRLVLRGQVSAPRAQEVLDDYDQLLITRWSSADDLRRRSLELRDNLSAYDAAYVSLAESVGCPLATRDRRLAEAAGSLIDVIVV